MIQIIECKTPSLARITSAHVLFVMLTLAPGLLIAQGIPGLEVPLSIKTNVSNTIHLEMNIGLPTLRQEVDLSVTGTTDPGGHANFVQSPPSGLEISLQDAFKIAFWQQSGASQVGWLDFGPMTLDDDLAFTGQSRATVAGFANILTVLTAIFTQDGITGTFSVGADGGLPGGQSIDYEFLIDAAIGLNMAIPFSSFFSIDATAAVSPQINFIAEAERKPEHLYLQMNAGPQPTDAEWWIVMLAGGEFLSFDLNTGTFVPGLQPTYQGPTVNVAEPVNFWSFPETTSGEVTVFFGIDSTQDGIVNESELLGSGYTYYFQ